MQYPAPPGGPGQPAPWTPPPSQPHGFPGGSVAMPGYPTEQLPPGTPRGGGRRAASGAAIFILVAGLLAAGFSAFLFLRGGGADAVAGMVPADAAVYSTYYLDPAGTQKVNLNRLIAKFPALSGAAAKDGASINDTLDRALRSLGLDHTDLTGWIGAQVGVSVATGSYASDVTTPAYAVFVATRNEGLTQSTIARLRRSPLAAPLAFTTENYDGVAITVVATVSQGAGSSPAGGFAYAIVGHALVVAANSGYMKAIVDTGGGRRASLETAAEYRTVQSRLPHDRLFGLYVDFPSAIKAFAAAAASGPRTTSVTAQKATASPLDDGFKAYRGMGITASVGPEGLAIDSIVDFDTAQLNEQSRRALGVAPHANTTSRDTPAAAMGFLGVSGVQYLLRGLIDSLRQSAPDASRVLDSIGLADATVHFTGDASLEFGIRDGKTPVGAWIVATDDEKATRAFLDRSMPSLMSSEGGLVAAAGPPPNPAAATITHEAYKGIDISEAAKGSSNHLAWTVTKGVGIVASDPIEVKAVIDAANGGANLAGSTSFNAALGDGVKSNAVLYVDVPRLTTALETSLPTAERQRFQSDVLPNLRPIQAVVLTQINSADHAAARLLIKIP